MATNQARWVRNLNGAPEPLVMLGLFQAGATQAIKRGELLELTGDGNTAWVPMDSDFAMDSNVAIANEEIKDGDRAGYYEIIVPRPGDVFEFELDAADDLSLGTALYWSDSETATDTAGSYVLGRVAGTDHYPQKQEHLADGGVADMGTTLRSQSRVHMAIRQVASYYSAIVQED